MSGLGMKRKESGWDNYKRKIAKQAEIKKQEGSLKKFLLPPSDKVIHDEPSTSPTFSEVSVSPSAIAAEEPLEEVAAETQLEITEISDDPSLWPSEVTDNIRLILVKKGPVQVKQRDCLFPLTNGRRFSENYYERVLCNNQKIERSWLLYSLKKDAVFCFPCKLFNSSSDNNWCSDGFCQW